jgi:hypothetical protein
MSRIEQHACRLILLALLITVIGVVQPARAQDDAPDEEPIARMPQFDRRVFEQTLDNWVFGSHGGALQYRNKLESNLLQRVGDLERTCGLSATQKKKIEVAGRGEIKRFFDRVEEAHRKVRALEGPWDNARVTLVNREAQPLQRTVAAPWFDDASLFGKAVRSTLSDEQAACYARSLRDRQVFRYQATVSWTAALLASNFGWTDQQRRRFESLVLAETRPPRQFHPREMSVVLYHASRIPEEKLKPIFDELQWRLLNQQLISARRMEQWLKNGGYIPDGEPDPRPGPIRKAGSGSVAEDELGHVLISADEF